MITPTLRLERPLGAGGMGSVWVATQLRLQTEVAVKFMLNPPNLSALERFSREATIAASIKSPNVVQIYDQGVTEEGVAFIVMELLQGEDLRQRVKRVGPLSLEETVGIASEVAKALGKAHAMGIVHRDIKPDNIFLVDPDGARQVKVLDFGIAKSFLADEMGITTTGAALGTPYYMSPEQMTSTKRVGPSADLWSFAVVVYFCLTGKQAFEAENLASLAIKVNAGVFPPMSELVSGVPPELDAFMTRALKIDPSLRYDSIESIMLALTTAARTGAPTTFASVASTGDRSFGGASAPQPFAHMTQLMPPTFAKKSVAPAPSSLMPTGPRLTPSVSPAAMTGESVASAASGTLGASARNTTESPPGPARGRAALVLALAGGAAAIAAGALFVPSVRHTLGIGAGAASTPAVSIEPSPSSPPRASEPSSAVVVAPSPPSAEPSAALPPSAASNAAAEPTSPPRTATPQNRATGAAHPTASEAKTAAPIKPSVPPPDGRLGF